MLKEINNSSIKQSDAGYKKRWFQSFYFDLIIWLDYQRNIVNFELCYNLYIREKVFMWSKKNGYRIAKVQDEMGDMNSHKYKMTSVYINDDNFNQTELLKRFKAESNNISPTIANQILDKINSYST